MAQEAGAPVAVAGGGGVVQPGEPVPTGVGVAAEVEAVPGNRLGQGGRKGVQAQLEHGCVAAVFGTECMRAHLPAGVACLHLPTRSSRSPVRYSMAPLTATTSITLGGAVTPEVRLDTLYRDQQRMAGEERAADLPTGQGHIRICSERDRLTPADARPNPGGRISGCPS